MNQAALLPTAGTTSAHTQYTAPDSIYIAKYKSNAYVGNYVEIRRRHCPNIETETEIKKREFGRIVSITTNTTNTTNTTAPPIKLQLFKLTSDLPRECRNSVPPLQHQHIRHLPEVYATNHHIYINPGEIIRYIFVFPATSITEKTSVFHPQGMIYYYIIRYHYNENRNR